MKKMKRLVYIDELHNNQLDAMSGNIPLHQFDYL